MYGKGKNKLYSRKKNPYLQIHVFHVHDNINVPLKVKNKTKQKQSH